MTSHELYDLLKKCGWETDPESVFHKIWGQPFDGVTERIKPATEESSATSCGQNPLHPRENCSWWQIGRCPTDCVHSATRLDL